MTALAQPDWRAWPPPHKQALLDRLRQLAHPPWDQIARPEQLPPDWPWDVWLILAGRGWGKTRTGAEWAAAKARQYPGCRIALVAQSFGHGRDTMIEGESGLLNVLAEHELRGESRDGAWNRSLGELFMANSSQFKIFSSEKPRQLRGPQHHFAWGDEPATWYDARKGPAEDTTWSNLVFGLRLTIDGSSPQTVVTGTPRPVRLLTQRDRAPKGLLHRDGVHITRGRTDDNLANLAESFRRAVIDPVRGTRLGRQELDAEVLEDLPGALWRRGWIDDQRTTVPPYNWRTKVMGLDPADGLEDGDEQAITIAGQGGDWEYYVLHSEGGRDSPLAWLSHALHLGRERQVDRVVIEKNHGGQFLVELLEQAIRHTGIRLPYRIVTASQGKATRAEPVAGIYEQRRVHHLDVFDVLEDQMTTWTGEGASPDRMDSLVWAMSDLMGLAQSPDDGIRTGAAVPYNEDRHAGGAVPYTDDLDAAIAYR